MSHDPALAAGVRAIAPGDGRSMRHEPPAGVLAASLLTLALACGAANAIDPEPPQAVEWIRLPMESGSPRNIAVLRPEGAPRGVVVAFPWGAGDANLLLGLLESYWGEAAPAAGYAVVGVEAYGPGLEEDAAAVMSAVLGWIDENLAAASGDIVMTGASAGGIGVFHAALAVPDRVGGIIAMPGRYSSEGSLEPLVGTPVWMMVGEGDTRWIEGSKDTAGRLEDAGADVTLDILPAQGHVLIVAQDALVRWMEGRQTP